MPNEIYCKSESINFKNELKNLHEYLLKAKWNLTGKWMKSIHVNSKLNMKKSSIHTYTHKADI